jgi:hypothetical protein
MHCTASQLSAWGCNTPTKAATSPAGWHTCVADAPDETGGIGVAVFFVLSGFVIYRSVARSRVTLPFVGRFIRSGRVEIAQHYGPQSVGRSQKLGHLAIQ